MKHLIGKNILEVIVDLPNQDWAFEDKNRIVKPKINELFFVYYQWKKPRDDVDLYNYVEVNKGISLEDLNFIKNEKKRGIGLISKVLLGEPYSKEQYQFAHIPFIDFDINDDFNFLNEMNLLNIIKNKIREVTELKKGIILKSSSRRNYHFIGTDTLLDKENFITFLGLCLTMKYKASDGRNLVLADARHIGHSLTPMKYISEIDGWSKYENIDRFSTLRINPKNQVEKYATVVDVLE